MKNSESTDMTRRKFLKTGAGFLLVCAGAGLGPVLFRNRRLYTMSRPLMGTIGEIQVVHDDADRAYRAMESAFEELDRLERILTFYSDSSEIGKVNRLAFDQEVSVSPETSELIARALHWSQATGGFFEPGLGKVIALWDVKHRTEPPPENQWVRLADRFFHKKIILSGDRSAPTVRFLSDDVKIDLGGIAKGYAADRAIEILVKEGVGQALVNLGGDIATLGGKSESEAWTIGVRDPENVSKIAKIISLKNQAVATSGSYEQYFLSQGHVYHHLIDPKLAMPGNAKFESLSIIGNNCRDTDALATGLFFSSDYEKQSFLEDHTDNFQFMKFGA